MRLDDLANWLLGDALDFPIQSLGRGGLEWESTTTTPSLVRITAALEFTLYRGAAIAAYTPSATCLSSKRSLSAVLASAANTQQESMCSNVWMAAAATPTCVKNCRRFQCVPMRYPLSC